MGAASSPVWEAPPAFPHAGFQWKPTPPHTSVGITAFPHACGIPVEADALSQVWGNRRLPTCGTAADAFLSRMSRHLAPANIAYNASPTPLNCPKSPFYAAFHLHTRYESAELTISAPPATLPPPSHSICHAALTPLPRARSASRVHRCAASAPWPPRRIAAGLQWPSS